MAEVTREEFDALVARVDRLDGTPEEVHPSVFVQAVPGPGYVDVIWSIVNKSQEPVDFTISRDGNDTTQTNREGWSTIDPGSIRSRRFDKLIPGATYRFTVQARFFSEPALTSDVVGVPLPLPLVPPVPEDPTTPPTSGESFLRPSGRRSGLPFNLTLFKGGTATVVYMDSNPLGVRFDGLLTFNTRGAGWNPSMDDGMIAKIISCQKAGGIAIVSMPHSMDGDSLMNQKGAKNEYKAQQIAMARYWQVKGVNPKLLVIRLDWEFNGGWYPWTAAAPGGTVALRDACKNFMDNWRAGGMTGTLFDSCANMPSSASSASWRDLWLGKGYWDIFTIDQYDAYPAVRSNADWEKKMVPVQSVRRCAQEALSFGVMWGIAECGNWHGSDGAGDNKVYWEQMFTEVNKFLKNMAYWNIYDDAGAPANLFHDFAHNPFAMARLKVLLSSVMGTKTNG